MSQQQADTARIWVERLAIPTYRIGPPNKNPMFLEKRVYQGSSGAVYPHPVIDKIYDDKEEHSYEAVFLENRWIKVMVLPELGGRVQMALDKTNDYHFVYYNRVIKPALVGLAGPWVSGGIEFNWPQHHRPNTFGPVDWRIEENANGSKTIWCSEIDRMCRTKGMHGLTIYPDRAYLEIEVQLYNRSSEAQTFLWWANPAVHVNDDYQSVFPPDVHAVMDHGKRDVSDFPIATGTYYKVNYAPGTDISLYKNIPVPTSFMAYHSDYNFLGCYDHGKEAGMLHVANHHVSPGKKQWTWGHSDFGQAWDRQLTDEDGPYIELMCGCFTDNQPDFTWLMPYEQKSFKQVFMPYKGIGAVKNASTEAALNLEVEGRCVHMGVYVTSPREKLRLCLMQDKTCYYEQPIVHASPAQALSFETTLAEEIPAHYLTLVLSAEDGHEILRFTPLKEHPDDIPEPARAALDPKAVATTEQLFLTGQHLEQYRHATFDPQDYYEEALRRDPSDLRNNNALGLLLYRRGRFAEAESHFRRAIKTLTQRNPNPYDGEPYYNLGLALKIQGQLNAAFDAFYKAVWNAAWQDAGYFELARLACVRESWEEALDLVTRSLYRNWLNHKARHLKVAILRHLQRFDEARTEINQAESLDKLDFGSLHERVLIEEAEDKPMEAATRRKALESWMRGDLHNTIEIALDYAQAGLWSEAIGLLEACPVEDALRWYYLGWFHAQAQQSEDAERCFQHAAGLTPGTTFPNRLECIQVFETAMQVCPGDAHAPYHLGNFLFARRDHERAISLWEHSREISSSFATVYRNLGLAYYNIRGDRDTALSALEKAFSLDTTDARVLFELDQLYRKLNRDPQERVAFLSRYPDLVDARDDLTIEWITLLNRVGRHAEALDILTTRQFHPWEGGEGKVTGQYVYTLMMNAHQAVARGNNRAAVDFLERAQRYPHNLGEGKLAGAVENHIHYDLGKAWESLGEKEQASNFFKRAAVGLDEPVLPRYYNDQPPDTIYYQGLALQKLGQMQEATLRFEKLVQFGKDHLEDEPRIDYFAVSLPDFLVFEEDLSERNRVHCHYMMGLGYLGLQRLPEARFHLDAVLTLDRMNLGAWSHFPDRRKGV